MQHPGGQFGRSLLGVRGCADPGQELRPSQAAAREQERERALQPERDRHAWERSRQAKTCAHLLETHLDLYKKKYQAALCQVGKLESQLQDLEEEARREAARPAEELGSLWSSSQGEGGPGSLSTRGMNWALPLTGQRDQTIQKLQEQLAASHSKLQQQTKSVTSLRREFASYKLTHSCSNEKYRKQMATQAVLRQRLRQAGEDLQQQAEAYRALVEELELELAGEAERSSRTLNDVTRLEVAVQSLCQEAAVEQSWQHLALAVLQHQALAVLQHPARPVQTLLGQSLQFCAQSEWNPGRLLRRARTNGRISRDGAHALDAASQEAGQGRVMQPRRPKSPSQPWKAAAKMAQEQPVELQPLGNVGCPAEVLPGRGRLPGAELERTRSLPSAEAGQGAPLWVKDDCFPLSSLGGAAAAAATSAGELLEEPVEEPSRSKGQTLQAASMLELETLRQQFQEAAWRVQGLQARVVEQKAENRSLHEQLSRWTAAHGHFRQARLQLQRQATEQIESLRVSLEVSRAGHHWLHQESELVVANVRQWVKEQKQMNEELGHKLRTQVKQIAQLTGERDLLHQLLERLQQDNQQLKNEANEKSMICVHIKALRNSDLEPQAGPQQPWPLLLLRTSASTPVTLAHLSRGRNQGRQIWRDGKACPEGPACSQQRSLPAD